MTEKQEQKLNTISLDVKEKRFDIDASKPLKINLKFSSIINKGDELLLNLKGDSEVKLGKGTDGKKIIGGASRYVSLNFDGSVFFLKYVCRF